MTNTARKMTPCHCQTFEFGEFDGGNEDAVSYDTECGQHTWKIFAMGHDAKLAGFLVRAELNGEEIRQTTGGVAITYPNAVAAARTISDAFAAKVAVQLTAGIAKALKKAAANNRKAAKTEAPAPTTVDATIKIGRWTYNATIDSATGDASYAMKNGETRTAKKGDYTEL